jgi:hypothetical protein
MLGIGTAIAGAGGFNPFFKAGGGQVVDSGISSLVPKPVIYRQTSGSLRDAFNTNKAKEILTNLSEKDELKRNRLKMMAMDKDNKLKQKMIMRRAGIDVNQNKTKPKATLRTTDPLKNTFKKAGVPSLISSAAASEIKNTDKPNLKNLLAGGIRKRGGKQTETTTTVTANQGQTSPVNPYAGTSALPALTPNSRSGRGELSSDFIRGMERLQQSQKDQKDKLAEIQSMNSEEKIKQRFC